MSFHNIQAGDRITFLQYNGLGLVRHGSKVGTEPQYKEVTATVNQLLIFEDHVVVNSGWAGQVVDANNYISAKPARWRGMKAS